MRRFAALLITVALVLTGTALLPCPDGRCAAVQARSMECCKQGGLTRPPCCDTEQLSHATTAPAAVERGIDVRTGSAGVHAPAALSLVVATPNRARRPVHDAARGKAPPGTLIAQHTSLLL